MSIETCFPVETFRGDCRFRATDGAGNVVFSTRLIDPWEPSTVTITASDAVKIYGFSIATTIHYGQGRPSVSKIVSLDAGGLPISLNSGDMFTITDVQMRLI